MTGDSHEPLGGPGRQSELIEERGELTVRERFLRRQQFRSDNQILNGNGTAPNLRGILNTTGINSYTPGTVEARVISIRRAVTSARSTSTRRPASCCTPQTGSSSSCQPTSPSRGGVAPHPSSPPGSRLYHPIDNGTDRQRHITARARRWTGSEGICSSVRMAPRSGGRFIGPPLRDARPDPISAPWTGATRDCVHGSPWAI